MMLPNCPACHRELAWHECEACDGRGVLDETPDTACLACDGDGGWYVCGNDDCRWIERDAPTHHPVTMTDKEIAEVRHVKELLAGFHMEETGEIARACCPATCECGYARAWNILDVLLERIGETEP